MEMLSAEYTCLLLTSEITQREVIPITFETLFIPAHISNEAEPDWIAAHFPSRHYQLVLDGYQFNASYQQKMKQKGYRLLYVDDFANEHMYADVVVNHSLGVQPANYQCEAYTRLALGTRYAILRPGFLEAARQHRTIQKIESVFVCFGGADKYDLTSRAVEALTHFEDIRSVNVVIGSAYPHLKIYDLQKKFSQIRIHKNLPEKKLIDVMQSADFAIVPASTILYEVCAVKMPVFSGYYVDNQKGLYEGCRKKGIIYPGGDFTHYTPGDFEKAVHAIKKEPEHQSYITAQSHLFDGDIRQRFIDLLRPVTYRLASSEDMLLVYEWANDKLSRANSYFSEPISLEVHEKWFEKKLSDDKTLIYIAELDGVPAGMIRYETGADYSVVGVALASDSRGKGLASVFLRDTSRLYFLRNNAQVLAYIKEENLASVKSFEKAGYVKLRNELVHGCQSVVYKLEKL
jgi:spore coat polysaccharide biosynthesis predicted glycosyltransferase SpsG/RimJ/RimL family protein N-acetyltransferase